MSYFDMCSQSELSMFELEAMLSELGIQKGTFDLYMHIPDSELPDALLPITVDGDVDMMLELVAYSRLQVIYCCPGGYGGDIDYNDFSFTQMLLDEKEVRIDDIREEIEERTILGNDSEGEREDDVDEASFHGDSSNLDSSENEVTAPPRRVKRIPPPNPPYRTRRRGRYSMLRVRMPLSLISYYSELSILCG